MLTKSKKHSDTSPVCQRHRIAVLSCFILPGLPSQALTRQLSQRESPWQRGDVFDETDWGLLENVTECQSLSLWERWHCEAMTERARMLTKSKKHSDTSPVCQRHRIAVLSCFILPGLPSQALTRQLPQSGSPWQRGDALRKHFNLTRNSLNKNQHRKLTGGGLYHLATCGAADSRLPDQRGGGAVPPHGGRLLRLRAVG